MCYVKLTGKCLSLALTCIENIEVFTELSSCSITSKHEHLISNQSTTLTPSTHRKRTSVRFFGFHRLVCCQNRIVIVFIKNLIVVVLDLEVLGPKVLFRFDIFIIMFLLLSVVTVYLSVQLVTSCFILVNPSLLCSAFNIKSICPLLDFFFFFHICHTYMFSQQIFHIVQR